MRIIYTILLTTCCFPGCTTPSSQKDKLGQMTLSPDDKTILFSYSRKGIASLYLLNLENGNVELFLKSEDISFYSPKYSNDGKKVVFIGQKVGDINSSIFLSDISDRNLVKLTSGSEIITEALFSEDDNEIYFIKANAYNKHSPVGLKMAHDFDIYRLNLESKNETKLTNRKSYRMNSLSYVKQGGYIIFEELNKGNFILSTASPDSIVSLVPSNNPREGLYSGYATPAYSSNFGILAFTAPYELYIMDMSDRIAKKVYRGVGYVEQVTFFSQQRQLLFSVDGENKFRIINFNGDMLATVPVRIP